MSSLSNILETLSYKGLPLLFAMVLHEYAHGWMAEKRGDSTAKIQGRLTLNPLAHVDPLGTVILPMICFMIPGSFLFGWAKPVPINPRKLYNPRQDMTLVAAAGPGMNLLLAGAAGIVVAGLVALAPIISAWKPTWPYTSPDLLIEMFLKPIAQMARNAIIINVFLALFNLLPIPPLDGGRILTCLLPAKPALALARLEPYGMFLLIGLILFDNELRVLHTLTTTLAVRLSESIFSTALGLGGVSQ